LINLLSRPGILTFSLAYDIAWVVGLVGGLVNARFLQPGYLRGRVWFLLICSLYGVAFQTWSLRMPQDFALQRWFIFMPGLCGTTLLLGMSVGMLLRRR